MYSSIVSSIFYTPHVKSTSFILFKKNLGIIYKTRKRVLMKNIFAFTVLSLLTAQGHASGYHMTKEGRMIMLDPSKVDPQTNIVEYYDYAAKDYLRVNLNDVSPETKEAVKGVKQHHYALMNDQGTNRPCMVWHVFEDGGAYVGCRTGEGSRRPGLARPQVLNRSLNSHYLMGEIPEYRGLKKNQVVKLTIPGDPECETEEVRIEALFANGQAFVQKTGFFISLDTSEPIMKYQAKMVKISDLQVIP